jgi:hypothetical protein
LPPNVTPFGNSRPPACGNADKRVTYVAD